MNYTFTTDDKDEAAMLLNASEAWAMLSEIRHTLRSCLKHDMLQDTESMYNEVCITLSRIET
jgi:hypothetical protein